MNLFTGFNRSSLLSKSSTAADNGKTSNNNTKLTKDSSPEVIAIVERIKCSSVLLQEPSHLVTAHFNRDEIGTGTVLRSGEFSTTFAVTRLPRYSVTAMALPLPAAMNSGDSLTVRSSAASHSQSPDEDERRRICTSTDASQYSLKQLNPKLIKKQSKQRGTMTTANSRLYDVAAATLVLEALYLARVSHPNIVALRGIPLGEEYIQRVHEGFFIMTDRIMETLAERLISWKEDEEASGAVVLKLDTRSKVFQEKLSIARQILDALDYLQTRHHIVVLNLNPSNIGFNQMGTVQLVDLGHCREVALEAKSTERSSHSHLHDDEISVDDLSVMLGSPVMAEEVSGPKSSYNHPALATIGSSSQQMGSHRRVLPLANLGIVPRYLPPELVTQGIYCLESDSYSFSLIFFEMLTLSKPFTALKPGQHLIQVCIEGKRPNLTLYRFPTALDKMLKQGWRHDHKKRLKVATMKQILSTTSFSSSSSRRRSSTQQGPQQQQQEQQQQQQQRQRQSVQQRSLPLPEEPSSEDMRRARRRTRTTAARAGSSRQLPERQPSQSLSPEHRNKPPVLANGGGNRVLRRKSDGNLFSMVSPTARRKSVQMTMAMRQKHQAAMDLFE